MKKLTTLLGTSLFAVSGLVAPLPESNVEQESSSQSSSTSTVRPSQKMALYSDCLRAHENVNGADFKQINKFCSCVADQSIQGDTGFASCATGEGGGGGGTFGMIGEMAPSVIMGVVQGISSNSGKSGGGGLLGKSGGLLDSLGGLLGGGGGGLLGGGGIGDLLKGR
jgi:hypothetical protein